MKVILKQYRSEKDKTWIEKEIYLDGYIKKNLDVGLELLHKDFDTVMLVDGYEGEGKSTIAITFAYYVSPPERRHNLLDRIVTKIEEADEIILNAEPFDAVVIDEAFGGMASMGFMSKLNKMLIRRFTEIRAKNLYVFILAPSFMDLSRYFAIWRSRCLIHVYAKGTQRGRAEFYNRDKKKKLYILGKKQFYNYNCVQPNFRFSFTKELSKVIDEEAYKKKKVYSNLELQSTQQEVIRREHLEILKRLDQLEPKIIDKQKAIILEVHERTIRQYRKDYKESNVWEMGRRRHIT